MAALAVGFPCVPALALPTGTADPYQGPYASAPALVTDGPNGITISNAGREREDVMVRLDEQRFDRSNDTFDDERDGGSGVGGSAGGVGSR